MTFELGRVRPRLIALAGLVLLALPIAFLWPQQSRGDTLVPGGLNGKIAFASDRAFAAGEEPGDSRSTSCQPSNGGNGPESDDECAFDIFGMNPDGSGVTNLTGGQAGENDALDDEPSWSPDGTKIAFVSRRDCADDSSPDTSPCTADVWVMNADGSSPRQLTDACGPEEDPGTDGCRPANVNDTHPSWSPDGTRLVFSRGGVREFDGEFSNFATGSLFTIPATGSPGSETALDTGAESGEAPFRFESDGLAYWSPDGSKIYFSRLAFEFAGPVPVAAQPSFVEDFLAGRLSKQQAQTIAAFFVHTFVVPAGGGDATPVGTPEACGIEETGFGDGCTLDLNPAVSADGSRIAVQRTAFAPFEGGASQDTDIVSFNATDGGGLTSLEAGDPEMCGDDEAERCFGDFKPAYSPQGDRFVFHSDRVESEADFCSPYFATLAYSFLGGGCQSAIYTMSLTGASTSGPLGRTALVAGEGPTFDRNADWQRLQPAAASACANDRQGPTVTITSNQRRANYKRDARASVRIQASDPSGLSVDPSTSSRRLSTRTTGRKSFTATAVDTCGNRGTNTFRYVVASEPRVSAGGVAGRRGSCTFSSFIVRVRIASPARMRRVDVLVDRRRIKRTRSKRFRVRVNTLRLKAGTHTFRVVATDRAGNRTVQRTRFRRCGAISPFFTG